MTRRALVGTFDIAREYRDSAVGYLERLRSLYARSDEPERLARVAALDAKIDALRAVHLDADALPWVEDWQ